jgi:hypothetical protein
MIEAIAQFFGVSEGTAGGIWLISYCGAAVISAYVAYRLVAYFDP